MNSNLELLRLAIAAGDKKAFDIFFREYFGKVRKYVFCLTRDEFASENIAQDIFLNLWVCRSSFADISKIDSYMFVCARNAALKALREQMRTKPYEDVDTGMASHCDTEDEVALHEMRQLLMEEIGRMPRQQRKVFCMSRFQGKSNADIAAELGISVRTVEAHIHSALLQLRKMHFFILFSFLTRLN